MSKAGPGAGAGPDDLIGETATSELRPSDPKIEAFADLSGDHNPLHLDDEYAEGTRYEGRIAHGMLVESTISAALAELPGIVSWINKDVQYTAPVRPGEWVEAQAEIVEDSGNGFYTVDVPVVNDDGDTVIESTHTVLIEDVGVGDDSDDGGDD